MSALYEITGDVLQLQEMLENDPENKAIQDTLEALEGELDLKAEAYCRVIRNMEANLEGYKLEIDRLSKRKKTLENSVDRLKKALFEAMQLTGTNKIEGKLFTIAIRNNAPQLPKDLDINKVPVQYLVEATPVINKRELLNDLKNGLDLSDLGICLEQRKSLRIS